MINFSNRDNIRQYVSEAMPSDIESYGKTYEELLDYATTEFRDFLYERGWNYGEEVKPEWLEELEYSDCSLWWSFFE
jgi:hypothetical protein